MSENPWHKRYHSDALTGYMELSLEERGAYTTILDMLYDRGDPLVDNERLIAGYLGVSLRRYRVIRESLIEHGKIYITDDGKISNRRFDKEIIKTAKTSRKRAENGANGGYKKAENQKKANKINDDGLAKSQPIPEARSQKPDIDSSYEESVQRVWDASPKKVGKGELRKALKPALKKTDIETIVSAMERYALSVQGSDPHYIKHPASWVRAERWNDEHTTHTQQSQQSGNRNSSSVLNAAARFRARRAADT